MLHLDEMGTLLVTIGIPIGIIILVITFVVCFVKPRCCCYSIIHKDKFLPGQGNLSENVDKQGYDKFTSGIIEKKGESILTNSTTKQDSCYSSMSDTSEGNVKKGKYFNKDLHKQINSENSSLYTNISFGEVILKLNYVVNEREQTGKLFITIQEAHNLQPRHYISPTANSFIEIIAFPNKSFHNSLQEEMTPTNKNRSQKVVFLLRTRTVRGTTSPNYDERFLAAVDMKNSDLKGWHIKVTVFDDDKFGNPTELGCADFPLYSAVNISNQEIIYKCCFKEPKANLGDLLFTIDYLPTAERVVFHIVKVSNIRMNNKSESKFNFQVHVLLISGMGRVLMKRKTSPGHGENGQSFEETLPFKVLSSQLTTITCLLLVCAKAESASDGTDTKDDDLNDVKGNGEKNDFNRIKEGCSKKYAKRLKEECIGKVFLGATVRVKQGQKHWQLMLQNPRSAVSMWHKLC